jgi:hypothetical protein
MNLKTTMHSQRALLLSLFVASAAHAGFQYNGRDVVIGFRQDGGSAELAINAGQVSTFYSLPNGTTITISNASYFLFTNAFPDFNNLHFAVSADVRTTGDATYPFETLWVLNPREDINTQSNPWARRSEYQQANTASKIDGIANGAVNYGGSVPTSDVNTNYGVVLPPGNAIYSYSTFIGNGNYKNTFPGIAECSTDGGFMDEGLPVRADFYQLVPGSGSGTYLGYFEFNTNGVLTFTAGAAAVVIPQPTITSIVRSGTTNIVSFTTVSGGNYSLRVTNGLGLTSPMSTWPVSGSPIPGDGTTKSLNDVTTAPFNLYGVSASP